MQFKSDRWGSGYITVDCSCENENLLAHLSVDERNPQNVLAAVELHLREHPDHEVDILIDGTWIATA